MNRNINYYIIDILLNNTSLTSVSAYIIIKASFVNMGITCIIFISLVIIDIFLVIIRHHRLKVSPHSCKVNGSLEMYKNDKFGTEQQIRLTREGNKIFFANRISNNSFATGTYDLCHFLLLLPGCSFSTRSSNTHIPGIIPFSLNVRRWCLFGVLQVRGVNAHILCHGETQENGGMIKVINVPP